jgi:cell division protease FtsH
LGPLTFGHKTEEVFLGRDIARDRNYSDAIAYAIDKAASQSMESAYHKAEGILQENMDKLHRVASYLIENETMEAEQFEQIMTEGQLQTEAGAGDEQNANAPGGPEQ